MEIKFVTHNGFSAVDTIENMKSIINMYHEMPAFASVQIEYERIKKDCVPIYASCKNRLNGTKTKKLENTLNTFMILLFDEFMEELTINGFTRPLTALQDGINYDAPEYCGLYLIGETHFNPITNETFYWIKEGKANNIKKRLADYNTHCPMLYRIDFKKCFSEKDAYKMEAYYQEKLKECAIASNNHNKEWFLVDRKTYLEICAQGFNYFNYTPLTTRACKSYKRKTKTFFKTH